MNKKWSLKEIELLKNIYSNEDINIIYKKFENRTKNAVLLKANKLGLKKTKKIGLCSGSKSFIYSIKDILMKYQIKSYIYKYKNCYILQISSKASIKNFLNNILNTNSDFLTRKKNKMVFLYNYSIS